MTFNVIASRVYISIHALLAESDVSSMLYDTSSLIFLSTLSLRRATCSVGFCLGAKAISIHALLAESDPAAVPCCPHADISIHALLAESDRT